MFSLLGSLKKTCMQVQVPNPELSATKKAPPDQQPPGSEPLGCSAQLPNSEVESGCLDVNQARGPRSSFLAFFSEFLSASPVPIS